MCSHGMFTKLRGGFELHLPSFECQSICHSSKDHSNAVKDEVMKLKQAEAIKEVFYPEWLGNTVVVKKKNVKWQVCMDFTYLNKACPKDPFPMPQID